MPAEIIDGKKIALQIRSELKKNIISLKEKGIVPGLAAVLVGDNPASAVYVKMKANACKDIGTKWSKSGRSAVFRVPSVIVPVEYNYMLNVGPPDFKKLKISKLSDFTFDPRMWK